jgi:ornithine cyclodeaminase/alanine dehydrogenase-like protein (mu-crystallin family)
MASAEGAGDGGPARPGGVELIGSAELMARLPMLAAIDALERVLSSAPFPVTPQRLHLEVDAAERGGEPAELLVMPAASPGWAGTKLVAVTGTNPAHGLPRVTSSYLLFGPPGLQPRAVLDGAALTGLRTAAVSGLATRLAARPDARRVVIVGSGVQARAHVLAMAAVIEDPEVTVVARDPKAVVSLIDHVRAAGSEVPIAVGGPDDLARADVICLCTSSPVPVIGLADVAGGVHINAVGAYRPDRREVASDLVAASIVLVETRAAALAEKGDLLLAEQEGSWSRESVRADLHELASGTLGARLSADERTLFASVGHAYEDLVIARSVIGSTSDRE